MSKGAVIIVSLIYFISDTLRMEEVAGTDIFWNRRSR